MQELRLVAVSEDGTYLVLATAGRGTRFTLPVDDRLRAAVRGNFSRLGQYEIEVESPLRPKEIQARIRAGETAEEIAATAGIPVERVRWFEGPVLQEREYVAQQAQRVAVRMPGESSPGPTLGELVAERLTRRGVPTDEIDWDSAKRDDGLWRVKLGYVWNGNTRHAEWLFDPRRRHVTPHDDEAMRLSAADFDPSPPVEDSTVTPFTPRPGKLQPVPPLTSDPLPFPSVVRQDPVMRHEPPARAPEFDAPLREDLRRPEPPARETGYARPGEPVRRATPSPWTPDFGARAPERPRDTQAFYAPVSPTLPPERPMAPEPTPVPAPEPTAHAEPEVPEPLPTTVVDKAPEPAPAPVTQPPADRAPAPEPMTAPKPEPMATPVATPEPAVAPVVAPEPVAAPEPVVTPEPAVAPVVASEPVATPEPVVTPVVTPVVAPEREPVAVAEPAVEAEDDLTTTAEPVAQEPEAPEVQEPIAATEPVATAAPEATPAAPITPEPAGPEPAAPEPVTAAPEPVAAPKPVVAEAVPEPVAEVATEPAAAEAVPEPVVEVKPEAAPPVPEPAPEPAPQPAAAATEREAEVPEPVADTAPEPVAAEAVPDEPAVPEKAVEPAAEQQEAAGKGKPAKKVPAARPSKEGKDEPPVPVPSPPPAPAARQARKGSRGRRASVPTWDEIMFGARKSD